MGYLSLCYHYIRPSQTEDRFPKILGSTEDDFRAHLGMLKNKFQIISLDEARQFSRGNFSFPTGKYGLLLTFDDGLSDHYRVAEILAEEGLRGAFFIPTCVLQDRLPANPTIIHYAIAIYRIDGFLKAYREALEHMHMPVGEYDIRFEKGKDDPWKKIAEIKAAFKYKFAHPVARDILLTVYGQLLEKGTHGVMQLMHLEEEQVRSILAMGHAVGAHSHTHLSVGAQELSEENFIREIITPRRYLEETFSVPVYAMSYPFGTAEDCLPAGELIQKTREYDLAFTTEMIINKENTPPLALGRYKPMSTDTPEKLQEVLVSIIRSSR